MKIEIVGKRGEDRINDGVLYCAQRIEEMVDDFTLSSCKVRAYNTYMLANEYIATAALVDSGTIDKAHLQIILEEFTELFSADIVIRENILDNRVKYYIQLLNSSTPFEQRSLMNYLVYIFKDYPNWCLKTLKQVCKTPIEKKKIEAALQSYLPMIIEMGYSVKYIHHVCLQIFTTQCNAKGLEAFLNHFMGVAEEYTVYFALDKMGLRFKNILQNSLDFKFEKINTPKQFVYDNSKYICISKKEFALDVYCAAKQAYYAFNRCIRYFNFFENKTVKWFGNNVLVQNFEDVFKEIELEVATPINIIFNQKDLLENSEVITEKLLANTGKNDYLRIEKAITLHNSALISQDKGNVFLNLWSLLEIISISNHAEAKIKEIMKATVPILQQKKKKNVFAAIMRSLKDNLKNKEYSELLQSVTEEGTEIYKIACLIALPAYKTKREELYNSYLSVYPLLRSRISQLNTDVFSQKKNFSSELKKYGKRLEWQIQRLYRVRNSIVHSGEIPDIMIDMIALLHEYVDEILTEIVVKMGQENSLVSIENALLFNKEFVDNLVHEFEGKKEFTKEDIMLLLE